MPYDVRMKDLYTNCLSDWVAKGDKDGQILRAVSWVDAENVRAVWQLVQVWFEYLQAGTADDHLPDPFWTPRPGRAPLSPEVADKIIQEMDEDLMIEVRRLNAVDPHLAGSGFARLSSRARLAFAQQYYDVTKLDWEIWDEAVRRRDAGEVLPPPEGDPRWTER